MTIPILLLLFGGGLLLIAIVGGGLEIREIKIPKVGSGPRILSGLLGALFLILGMSIPEQANYPPPVHPVAQTFQPVAQASQPVAPSSRRIRFVIYDRLIPAMGALDQSEQVRVRINGRVIGTLTVNRSFPEAELDVSVEKEGQHSFAIEGTAVLPISNPPIQVSCYGTGTIEVAEGDRFSVEGRLDDRGSCLAWLEKR